MSPTTVDLSSIESYLLSPAHLSQAITLEEFRQLFPAAVRKSTDVEALYQAIEEQRDRDIAHVAANIAEEAERRRDLLTQATIPEACASNTEARREADLDRLLVSDRVITARPPESQHLKTVLPAMEDACKALEVEIEALSAREQELMMRLHTTVGDLSDLRYGKLPTDANGVSLADGASDALREFRDSEKTRSG